MRLADLHEMEEEMNAMGYRYYTLESRTIPYRSPNVSTHPASVKAKEAADSLNEAYQEALNAHQVIRGKLNEFKKLVGQPEYADLSLCFASLKSLSGKEKVKLICSETTNDPLELVGGSEAVKEPVKILNEMLNACHVFLKETDVYIERIKKRIESLKLLAVMQQILTISSTFETQASTNVNIFATEIRSLLLDIRSAAKLKLK